MLRIKYEAIAKSQTARGTQARIPPGSEDVNRALTDLKTGIEKASTDILAFLNTSKQQLKVIGDIKNASFVVKKLTEMLLRVTAYKTALDRVPFNDTVQDPKNLAVFVEYEKKFHLEKVLQYKSELEELLKAKKNIYKKAHDKSPPTPVTITPDTPGVVDEKTDYLSTPIVSDKRIIYESPENVVDDEIIINVPTRANHTPLYVVDIFGDTIAHAFEQHIVDVASARGIIAKGELAEQFKEKLKKLAEQREKDDFSEATELAKIAIKFAIKEELEDVTFIMQQLKESSLAEPFQQLKKVLEKKLENLKDVKDRNSVAFDIYDVEEMSAVGIERAVEKGLLKFEGVVYLSIWEQIRKGEELDLKAFFDRAKEKISVPGYKGADPVIEIGKDNVEAQEKVVPYMIRAEILRYILSHRYELKLQEKQILPPPFSPNNGKQESDDGTDIEEDSGSEDDDGTDIEEDSESEDDDETDNKEDSESEDDDETDGGVDPLDGGKKQLVKRGLFGYMLSKHSTIGSFLYLSLNSARSDVPSDVLEAARSIQPLENYYKVLRKRLNLFVMDYANVLFRDAQEEISKFQMFLEDIDVRRMRILQTEADALGAPPNAMGDYIIVLYLLKKNNLEPRLNQSRDTGPSTTEGRESQNPVQRARRFLPKLTENQLEKALFAQDEKSISTIERERAELLEKLAREPPPPKTLVLSYSADRLATYARAMRDDIEEAYLSFYAQGVDCDQLSAGSNVLHLVHRAPPGIHRAEILLPTDLRIDGTLYGTLTIHWRHNEAVELRAPGALEHTATLHDVRSGTRMRGRDAVGARITWRVPESVVRPELGAGVPHGAMIEYEGAPSAASRAPDLFHLTATGRLEAPERVSRRLDESSYQRAFADRLIAHLATLAPPDGAEIGRENLERAQLIVRILNGMLLGSEPLPNSFVLAYALGRS